MKSRIKIILPRKNAVPKIVIYTNRINIINYNEAKIKNLKDDGYISVIDTHNRIIIDVIKYNRFYLIGKGPRRLVLVFDSKQFKTLSVQPHDIKNPAITKFYPNKTTEEYFIDGIKIDQVNFQKAAREYKIKKVLQNS